MKAKFLILFIFAFFGMTESSFAQKKKKHYKKHYYKHTPPGPPHPVVYRHRAPAPPRPVIILPPKPPRPVVIVPPRPPRPWRPGTP